MTVVVYSTPNCVYCSMLKQFLKENHVIFEEVDVSEDDSGADRLFEISGQYAVPVTFFDAKHVIIGFDKKALVECIKELNL